MRTATISTALVAVFLGTAAPAYDPVVLKRGWHRVASDQSDDCRAEVGTNGQFYVLSVTGLSPGGAGRLQLFNGDMVPVDWAIRASATGTWQHYYIPFRFNRGEGGTVLAQVSAAECDLALAFPWQRRKGWEERLPLRNRAPR
jgi:hypothetical protein